MNEVLRGNKFKARTPSFNPRDVPGHTAKDSCQEYSPPAEGGGSFCLPAWGLGGCGWTAVVSLLNVIDEGVLYGGCHTTKDHQRYARPANRGKSKHFSEIPDGQPPPWFINGMITILFKEEEK